MAALWATLGVGWPTVRLSVLLSIVAAAVTGLAYLRFFVPTIIASCILVVPQVLIVFVSLLVVRVAGYRLTWQRRARAVAGPSA